MPAIEAIPIPLPHVGSVNAWLLRGDPLTLVDSGPRSDAALEALTRGLSDRGVALTDIELVIGTHHHHDHVGLAATIRRVSGAPIALIETAAVYAARYHDNVELDRVFSRALLRAHGAPDALSAPAEALWDYIGATAESFDADIRLRDGDVIRAGGRDLQVHARPGHSRSDTLFVDARARVAFAGDHLLARISPNTEVTGEPGRARTRPRLDYVRSLRRTARMPLARLFPGHGPLLCGARERVRRELAHQRRRCRRIIAILERGPLSAFDVAQSIWPQDTVREQPLLVIWEVLGHLDVLVMAGVAREALADDGRVTYALERTGGATRERDRVLVG